jgi:hypothetical protein
MFTGLTGRILGIGGRMVFGDRTFLDKIFADNPVRWGCIPKRFHAGYLMMSGRERSVMDFLRRSRKCRSCGFIQLKKITGVP